MAKNSSITLRDMALQAGVNVGTVSRALADHPTISHERKKQIRQLADKLNYHPQPFRRKQTDAIAIFSVTSARSEPEDLFQQRIIVLLEQRAQQLGKHIHMHLIPRQEQNLPVPALIRERRVDGVILSGHPDRALCDKLAEQQIPLAVINDFHDRTGLPSVICDSPGAVEQTVNKLHDLGHRRFAYAAGNLEYTNIVARHEGFKRALASLGLEQPEIFQQVFNQGNMTTGQQAVRKLFANRKTAPTAVFFNNDWMAIGGLLEFAKMGIRVPEDVSIIGCDNQATAVGVQPSLTSIDLNLEQQVEVALDMIQQQCDDEDCDTFQLLPAQLVWRESAAEAAIRHTASESRSPRSKRPDSVRSESLVSSVKSPSSSVSFLQGESR